MTVVRRAIVSDAPALALIQVRAWHHAFADVVHPLEMPGVDEQTQLWQGRLVAPGICALVAEASDAVRGFVAFGPASDAEPGEESAGEIHALFVDPVAQGAGLGGRLLADAQGELLAAGYREAVLWTLEAALARSLYERRGWSLDRPATPAHGALRAPEVRYRHRLG